MVWATSPVSARLAPPRVSVVLLLVVARSATSAAVSVTLLGTALRAAATVVALAAVSRLATLAVASDTWLATAPTDRSATTVGYCTLHNLSGSVRHANTVFLGGEVGHVSRDCPTEAKGERVCYNCKQPGHVQAACPN